MSHPGTVERHRKASGIPLTRAPSNAVLSFAFSQWFADNSGGEALTFHAEVQAAADYARNWQTLFAFVRGDRGRGDPNARVAAGRALLEWWQQSLADREWCLDPRETATHHEIARTVVDVLRLPAPNARLLLPCSMCGVIFTSAGGRSRVCSQGACSKPYERRLRCHVSGGRPWYPSGGFYRAGPHSGRVSWFVVCNQVDCASAFNAERFDAKYCDRHDLMTVRRAAKRDPTPSYKRFVFRVTRGVPYMETDTQDEQGRLQRCRIGSDGFVARNQAEFVQLALIASRRELIAVEPLGSP